MLNSIWRRLSQGRLCTSPSSKPAKRKILAFDVLEDRVTPSNFTTAISGTVLTITKVGTDNDSLSIVNAGSFQRFTLNASGNSEINGALTTWDTPTPITSIVVKLGKGNDNLTFDGTANGLINLPTGLTISGTGGDKNITLDTVELSYDNSLKANNKARTALKISLTGSGAQDTQFTDVNIAGAAAISHSGTGDTNLQIDTSGNNALAMNTWGSLTITNGKGSDITIIEDTYFTGGVNFKYGAGTGSSPAQQYGGSRTIFRAGNNQSLLSIHGGVTVATTNGQSAFQLYDYNVHGIVNVNTGVGVNNQATANVVEIQNDQTTADTIPTLGGVTITGTTRSGLNPGFLVNMGTNNGGSDFPLIIQGPINITGKGTGNGNGAIEINLNDLTVSGATNLTLGSNTDNNVINVQGDDATTLFGPMTITATSTGNSSYNIQTIQGTAIFAGSLSFVLGSGADTMLIGDVSNTGFVNVNNNLAISGKGIGNKVLNAQYASLGGVNVNLTGNSSEGFTFTDVNVAGAAVVNHTGTGSTDFTIRTSSDNDYFLNTWNSLAITNGKGTDYITITDTDFAGNVTIKNGAGTTNNTGQYGGSHTVFSAARYPTLLAIHGNLTIETANGQSESQIFDYNVHGNVSINTGKGINGQSFANYVGIQDDQTNSDSGVPIIGGSVTVTGTAVSGLNPGLRINLGSNNSNADFPLIIGGNLTINTNGQGAATITLNDLTVNGLDSVTNINLGSTTQDNTVNVRGSTVTSIFNNFNITSKAVGTNTFNLQNQAGNLRFTGKVKVKLGKGDDRVNAAANSGNVNGVTDAIIEFFDTSSFDGGPGADLMFLGTPDTNVFYFTVPVISNFP